MGRWIPILLLGGLLLLVATGTGVAAGAVGAGALRPSPPPKKKKTSGLSASQVSQGFKEWADAYASVKSDFAKVKEVQGRRADVAVTGQQTGVEASF